MVEEKLITVSMRKNLSRVRRGKKSNKLIAVLRKKIQGMYKDQRVIIDKTVNEEIWRGGIKNPMTRLKLKITKNDDKSVKVELGK